MDVVFVILFVLTVFMLSMYSRFKRILAEQEGIQEEAAHAAATSEEGHPLRCLLFGMKTRLRYPIYSLDRISTSVKPSLAR